MRKIKGFTLLESLAVIGIIGVISTALYNMRNVGNDYTDYRQEAVNVIYKEIAQSLKDFQRNKIWKDPQGNEHEIDTFEITFGDTGKLEIGYTYIYCTSGSTDIIIPCYTDNGDFYQNNIQGSGYFDSITLISGQKYASKKGIKDIDKYNFLVSGDTEYINVYPNGNFDVGLDYIYSFVESITEMTVAGNQTFSETIGEGGTTLDGNACGKIRSECIENLCTSSNPWHHHHNDRRKAACIRQKTRNISPQDMSTLKRPRHGRRDRRLGFWGMGGANDRRRMDGCLQTSGYYGGGCDIKQRRNDNEAYTTTIIQNENYGSTTAEENSVYLSFYIYANEDNSKSCTTNNGTNGTFKPNNDNTTRVDPAGDDVKTYDTTDFTTNDPSLNTNEEPSQGNGSTAIKGKKRQPIGKITINAVAKTVSLEWCNNDKIKNGINCGGSICQ